MSHYILLSDGYMAIKGSCLTSLPASTDGSLRAVRSEDTDDLFHVDISKLLKVSKESYHRLLPMSPKERIDLFSRNEFETILAAKVQDKVYVNNELGVISYIGPIREGERKHFYQVIIANPRRDKVFCTPINLRMNDFYADSYSSFKRKQFRNKMQNAGLSPTENWSHITPLSSSQIISSFSNANDAESKEKIEDPIRQRLESPAENDVYSTVVCRNNIKSTTRFNKINNRGSNTEDEEDFIDNTSSEHTLRNIEPGSLVEIYVNESPCYGVVKWIGLLEDNYDETMVGIELEDRLEGAGNGRIRDKTLFLCPDGHGAFVPLSQVEHDSRFIENGIRSILKTSQNRRISSDFGSMDCPAVKVQQDPIPMEDLFKIRGRNHGIQGYQNSCYLDATLFAMFAFTSIFDFLLFRPPSNDDIPQYEILQEVLREEIINPLRKNHFVRADKVMKLRKFLDSFSSVEGLISEEKDPEEFLNSLLCQTLKAPPFLELSSGQTSHTYQLFFERDERLKAPTVQQLLEQSFHTSGIKLKRMPSVFILQMPRFGKQFKVYERIMPSEILDVTDIIEASPRQCIVCGSLAYLECPPCYSEHGRGGLDATAYCYNCFSKTHDSHKNRVNHTPKELKVSSEFIKNGVHSRLYMELFAVLCIETSHYITFTKGGQNPCSPWVFFDSMADRKGESNGYNIPEVLEAPDIHQCFKDISMYQDVLDDRMLPEHARRLICDGYMYFYQSKEMMMYQ